MMAKRSKKNAKCMQLECSYNVPTLCKDSKERLCWVTCNILGQFEFFILDNFYSSVLHMTCFGARNNKNLQWKILNWSNVGLRLLVLIRLCGGGYSIFMGIDKELYERHAIYNPFIPALNRYPPMQLPRWVQLWMKVNYLQIILQMLYLDTLLHILFWHRTLKKAL